MLPLNPIYFINGKTKLYGIIGNPVDQSRSPYMYNAAFASMGISSVYIPFHIANREKPDFSQLFTSFFNLGVQGFNVTAPYKQAIIPFLDELSTLAKVSNSVNTVVYKKGKWIGHSTDGIGFVKAIEEANWKLEGESVFLLGAGGGAFSIGPALAQAKIKKLIIRNIEEAPALQLQKNLQAEYPSLEIVINPSVLPEYSYLINATPVGWHDSNLPVTKEEVKQAIYVIDLIYQVETPLLKLAKEENKQQQDGLGMLLHQGVEAFKIWNEVVPPIEAMKKALLDNI